MDLDLVADRTGAVLVGGVLEHIEEAGVHSGDAACTLPPHSLSPDLVERMKDQAIALARELGVVGLMNVQFAIQGKAIYVLEVNPRASPHGAVHLQGHRACRWRRSRRSAWWARRWRSWACTRGARVQARGGEGVGVPVRALLRGGRASSGRR